jgi:DNA-binding transcriptional ArsR family regulator
MSGKRASTIGDPRRLRRHAPVFAALSDETRLSLLATLSAGVPCSITQLSADAKMSRQAITKHLRVLENVGLVRAETAGRECLFELQPRPLQEISGYLDLVSKQWDEALVRLRKLVERDDEKRD